MHGFIKRLAETRLGAGIFAAILTPIDLRFARWSGGSLTLTETLSGLPVATLTTTGARTRKPRSVPVVAIDDGDRLVIFGSSFGRSHQPGWDYNLRADPRATIARKGRVQAVLAREADEREREGYWARALKVYAGFGKYQERAGRRIPIWVLEAAAPGGA